MSEKTEIRDAIRKIAGTYNPKFNTVEGMVKSVDWDNRVCTVNVNDGYELQNVRLRAVKDGKTNGWACKPTVGSTVLVSIIYGKDMNAFISMFSDIDEMVLLDDNGNSKMNVDVSNGNFVFNTGSNKGMVIVQALVDKINQLEQKLSDFATYVGALPIPVSFAVSGPPVPANTLPFKVNQKTTVADLENKKVKH